MIYFLQFWIVQNGLFIRLYLKSCFQLHLIIIFMFDKFKKRTFSFDTSILLKKENQPEQTMRKLPSFSQYHKLPQQKQKFELFNNHKNHEKDISKYLNNSNQIQSYDQAMDHIKNNKQYSKKFKLQHELNFTFLNMVNCKYKQQRSHPKSQHLQQIHKEQKNQYIDSLRYSNPREEYKKEEEKFKFQLEEERQRQLKIQQRPQKIQVSMANRASFLGRASSQNIINCVQQFIRAKRFSKAIEKNNLINQYKKRQKQYNLEKFQRKARFISKFSIQLEDLKQGLIFGKEPFSKKNGREFMKLTKENQFHILIPMLHQDQHLVYEFDLYHQTALHWACKKNHIFMVKYLILMHSDIQAQDILGRTPLMLAVENNHYFCAKLLFLAGARPWLGHNNHLSRMAKQNSDVQLLINLFKMYDIVLRLTSRKIQDQINSHLWSRFHSDKFINEQIVDEQEIYNHHLQIFKLDNFIEQ